MIIKYKLVIETNNVKSVCSFDFWRGMSSE